ncbi:hypothetical protein FA15DRAFT_578117, partial [Coprinopsis marcescibilis]
LASSLALAGYVNALLRFPCSQLVVERFDPLVTPGIVSPHVHQIVGGNAFNITMSPSNDLPSLSTCTTCSFTEDLSNYWTAVLYFRHKNGSFERVPQIPEELVGPANGGMTLYYIQNAAKVTAFPKGFRMIVGDPALRSYNTSSLEAQNLSFRCLNAGFGNPDEGNGGPIADPGTDTRHLPTNPCKGGVRSEIFFPYCWDGVNLDTPDHKSHMVYPTRGKQCPETHPVVVPQIFIEIVWDTKKFNHLWEEGASNPFLFSHGDPTGYGQHADYIFGWEGDSLQRAMDQCTSYGGPCRTLKSQSIESINRCVQKNRVREPVDGALPALPGCNPVQPGPAKATPITKCDA